MYTIEVTLRNTPLIMTVERKELADAETLYRTIVTALQASTPQLLELTCEKQAEKKIGVLSSEITAVQMSDKSGKAATGTAAGFGAFLGQ